MMFSDSDFRSIRDGKFTLDFVEATLTQLGSDDPVVLAGSGSVTQDASGNLKFKFYTKIQNQKVLQRLSGRWFLTPGVIIEEDQYYVLIGKDRFDNSWEARRVHPDFSISFVNNSCVVNAEIRSIGTRHEVHGGRQKSVKVFLIPGEHQFPYNDSQIGTEEQGFSKCTLYLGEGRTCEVRTTRGSVLVTIEPGGRELDEYSIRVLDAVSIACGSLLRPQAELSLSGDVAVSTVFSADVGKDKLSPPISLGGSKTKEFESVVRALVDCDSTVFHSVFGFWYRVLRAFDNGLENAAVVLTTAIEGVLKVAFQGLVYPNAEAAEEVDGAKAAIKGMNTLTPAMRNRLLSSLAQLGSPTAFRVLKDLA